MISGSSRSSRVASVAELLLTLPCEQIEARLDRVRRKTIHSLIVIRLFIIGGEVWWIEREERFSRVEVFDRSWRQFLRADFDGPVEACSARFDQ